MLTATTAIRTYFAKLGLESEVADLYLALHSHGPQTISELSRNSGVERTRIYRLIDRLMGSNLIEVEPQHKRGTIKAAPIANLNILITQKEQELKSLQDELGLIEQVLARNSLSSPAMRIQFYKGPEGVKQMLTNETKAETEILGIYSEDPPIKTGSRFFERWVEKCNEKDLRFRSVFGKNSMKSLEEWHGKGGDRIKYRETRIAPDDVLHVAHTTLVYDDVVTYYNWHDGEIFGTEMYSKDIANMQRALFELLWQRAAAQG